MTYKTSETDLWESERNEWPAAQYYDRAELLKQYRRRNLIFVAAFMVYLALSAVVLLF